MHSAELLDIVVDLIARTPSLHLHQGTPLDGGLGETDYDTTTITVSPTATRNETRCAVVAGLLYLHRGPAPDDGSEEDEERSIHEAVARLLVPRAALPAMLDTADPEQVAQHCHVDLPTARLGIALARAEEHPTEDR